MYRELALVALIPGTRAKTSAQIIKIIAIFFIDKLYGR